ncbi:hypothetical protein CCP3SC1_610018 [Gammaproteobacteria bacterium]
MVRLLLFYRTNISIDSIEEPL